MSIYIARLPFCSSFLVSTTERSTINEDDRPFGSAKIVLLCPCLVLCLFDRKLPPIRSVNGRHQNGLYICQLTRKGWSALFVFFFALLVPYILLALPSRRSSASSRIHSGPSMFLESGGPNLEQTIRLSCSLVGYECQLSFVGFQWWIWQPRHWVVAACCCGPFRSRATIFTNSLRKHLQLGASRA